MISLTLEKTPSPEKTQKDFESEAAFWKTAKNVMKLITLTGVFALLFVSLSVSFYPRLAMRALCILSVISLKALCDNDISPLEQTALSAAHKLQTSNGKGTV